jgi:hypothetical protein
MAGYATYELALKLAALSTQQRAAIDRIVEHVYILNRPLAELLRGDDKICSERRYYGHGKLDEDTGRWLTPPGWHHDKAFQDALGEAVRLALQTRSREELAAIQDAKRRSRLASPNIVEELITIATRRRAAEDRDSITAAKTLLDYGAVADSSEPATATSAAADWWKAAGGE